MRNGCTDKENDLRLTNGWTETIVHIGTKYCQPPGFSLPYPSTTCNTTCSTVTGLPMDVMAGRYDTATSTDLVALVNAVDELRVRGCPRKTDSCRVDRLGLHVAWSDGGYWDGCEKEEKVRWSGRKKEIKKGKRQKTNQKAGVWQWLLVYCWKSACICLDVSIDCCCIGQGRYRHHSLVRKPHTRTLCGCVCGGGTCLWILESFVCFLRMPVNGRVSGQQSALAGC